MGAHKADIHDPIGIVDLHYQPIFVSGDVEANSVIRKDAGASIIRFHLRRGFPVRLLRELEPRLQRLFGVWVAVPELLKRFAGDDPHESSIIMFPFWDQAYNERVSGRNNIQQYHL